ncbi:MAG: hypothetical protein Unbinned1446contig1004_4 [Prokaryotic dsDNA virus sp.]|nr:MAG: hypothetical protein Unbinned1446contig1004_4 [Prokaryotic dsDNA virus sp.]|tara:strand:+ start:10550 stop:10750 length:201 start_codon:yes stop_codon:yes gene_type:complete
MTDNGWEQYQKLVLNELTKHGDRLEKMSEQMIKHGEELAQLKVKAGIWGAVSGTVVGIGSFIMSKL